MPITDEAMLTRVAGERKQRGASAAIFQREVIMLENAIGGRVHEPAGVSHKHVLQPTCHLHSNRGFDV